MNDDQRSVSDVYRDLANQRWKSTVFNEDEFQTCAYDGTLICKRGAGLHEQDAEEVAALIAAAPEMAQMLARILHRYDIGSLDEGDNTAVMEETRRVLKTAGVE